MATHNSIKRIRIPAAVARLVGQGFLFMAGRITALKVQKRNQNRVNVYLDGEFAFGLARLVAAWLQIGQDLGDEKIAELLAQDAREAAYQRALHYMNYRDRSEAEIRRHLNDHQVPEDIQDEVVSRLQRSGLLSDPRFARTWVDNRSEFRPRSRRALAQELRLRGLDHETITDALESVDETDLAYRAGSKQARRYAGLPWPEFRQKVCAFLGRRGFGYEIAASTAVRLWEDCNPEQQVDDSDDEVNL